jgi:DNA-directed RNA polymerase II subunit RPB2
MSFNFKKHTFNVVDSMFQNNYIVNKIQQESYNDFIEYIIPVIIEQYNPLNYKYEDELGKKYVLHLVIKNHRIVYPKVCDNDGTQHDLTPTLARLRNYTYSSKIIVDIVKTTTIYENDVVIKKEENILNDIIIGKVPIMVNSKYCLNLKNKENLNECKYDKGGYFIINGIEKVIVLQERCIDNHGLCFNQKNTKYKYILELKSSIKGKFLPTKPLLIKLFSKDNSIYGNYIRIMMPYFKQDIPLFIIMRALGFESDKEIIKLIILDLSDLKHKDVLNILESSIEDSGNVKTKEEALDYISNNLTNIPKDAKNKDKIYEYINYLFTNEYIPHVGESFIKKGLYTGYLVLKLLQCSLGIRECDDRDSYLNKRVDSPGALLGALLRQYYIKMIKELKTSCNKEFNNGSWKATDNFSNIINESNIYKIIKPTIIENGLKFALATGNFGIKNTFNKQGISQLYNKMSFNSVNSHLRRINTPIEKCGKLIPPRKQHGTQWGYICPAETPEGQSVGVVKNISLSAIISLNSSLLPIIKELNKCNLILLDDIKEKKDIQYNILSYSSKIFINGDWYASTNNITEIYEKLLHCRRNGILNIYTSIIFNKFESELYIYTDAGRLLRPLYILDKGKFKITNEIAELVRKKNLDWNSLLGIPNYKLNIEEIEKLDKNTIEKMYSNSQAYIEYLDPSETATSLISMNENIISEKYTHCEIHPYLILGAIASTIPFSDHNQSPRNTYQSAMGKQAIGICATNYADRMDTISHLLYYPQKPLVITKSMPYLHTTDMPSGINAIIAIATYTGYNQEDSILMNKSAIDRGLFLSAYFKTYKEEEKKNQNSGDEEKFCIPKAENTINYKLANYDKLNSEGIIKENTFVNNGDVIIGKTIPFKKNEKKEYIYKDNSIVLKANQESGRVFKVYVGRNGDGYKFCKVQIKNERYPTVGDKFCIREDSYILTDSGWMKFKDIDITKHKVATMNKEQQLDYVYPINKYEFDCDDEDLYHYENKQIKIICTKNHKLYVQKRSAKEYDFMEAQDAFGKMLRYKKDVINKFPDQEYIVFENVRFPMDAWLKLLGIYIADGSRAGNNRQIKLCGLKDRKKEFMYSVCEELDIEYTIEDEGVRISGAKYPDILNNLEHKDALTKYLPDYVWSLSERQSRVLLDSLMRCDGSTYTYKGEPSFQRYGTISIQLANDIQKLAFHCGWSGVIKLAEEATGKTRVGKRNLGKRAGTTVEITQKHDYYKISIITKQNNPWVNKKKNDSNTEEYIKYTGKVGCVEVPDTHLFYYKEDLCSPALWSGNSSRHGQKGTVGMVFNHEDLPFSASGIVPDCIINPHAIPSRMTIGQLIECLLGKSCSILGRQGDSTPFTDLDPKKISDILSNECGFEPYGNEILYNGMTGEQLLVNIFMGPTFYQRLKHMVIDKYHSRSTGPVVLLTRQPAEGRTRDGGLRFGEMERDCIISHGASAFLKERLLDVSDNYKVYICNKCHMLGAVNPQKNIYKCDHCPNTTLFSEIRLPYACKLLIQELISMSIVPRLITE